MLIKLQIKIQTNLNEKTDHNSRLITGTCIVNYCRLLLQKRHPFFNRICHCYFLYHYGNQGKIQYGSKREQVKMKLLFILLLTIVSTRLSAQTGDRIFYSQLMVVFSDLGKNFEFLKGELKDANGRDTLYTSNTTLEGTKDNTILVSSDLFAYQAMISDSGSYEGSKFILKAWREKLNNALTGSLSQPEKEFHSEHNKDIDGYMYSSEKITVLLLLHKLDEASCWINLVIKAQ